jgi:hypothetical protein
MPSRAGGSKGGATEEAGFLPASSRVGNRVEQCANAAMLHCFHIRASMSDVGFTGRWFRCETVAQKDLQACWGRLC